MAEPTQVDRYLLEKIRSNDAEAWSQLVDRYQGRLLAYARRAARNPSDAADLIQETFLGFLRSVPTFRGDASIETYLFTILRNQTNSYYRAANRRGSEIGDRHSSASTVRRIGAAEQLAASDPTASWYVRRNEETEILRTALIRAIREMLSRFKDDSNFEDIQIIELIFYRQMPNKEIAETMGVRPNRVAVLKHRCLEDIRTRIPTSISYSDSATEREDIVLSRIWREHRISCLKRSTIGSYLLGTLDDDWRDYVSFHINQTGCDYCRANLDDLELQTAGGETRNLRDRILQSSVGFFSSR
jgi:RNA polymerase sigma factor (sigma-70 family)